MVILEVCLFLWPIKNLKAVEDRGNPKKKSAQ